MNPMKDDDLLPDEREMLEGKPVATTTAKPDEAEAATAAAEAEPAVADPAPAKPADGGATAVEPEPATSAMPTYDAGAVRDFKAERATLRAEELAIDKKWSEGELSDEERAAQVAPIRDKIEDAIAAQASANTIADLNRQAAINEQRSALNAVSEASKKAGELDYADAKVATAYDSMLRAVLSDPDRADKTFAENAQAAHEALCATRGVKRSAPAPALAAVQATPAAPAARPVIPTTLSGLPAAAATPIGNDVMTTLAATTDPDQAEALLGAMSASQREALLRSTLPAANSRH